MITEEEDLAIRRFAFQIAQKNGWFEGETLDSMVLTFANEHFWGEYYDLARVTFLHWRRYFKTKKRAK